MAFSVQNPGGAHRMAFRPWLFALLVCLPYWSLWFYPVLATPPGSAPTLLPLYDQAYYSANGRAIFERGNGLAGPNPYDPDPAAPAIYFHLLNWIFGFAVAVAGLDPGIVYVTTGILSGLVFSRLTLALLERMVVSRRSLGLLFPLAMWGGGIATLLYGLARASGQLEPGTSPLVFQPDDGWWMLPWGSNLAYATEAFYHCLVLGLFIAFLDRHRWRFILMTALIAASHPFTGAQVLLAVGIFTGIHLLAPQRIGLPRLSVAAAAALLSIATLFGAYYLFFLPSHPAHAELVKAWTIDWQETPTQTVAAYLPLFLAVVFAGRRGQWPARPELSFFGIFAIVSFLLSHHGYFTRAHQPLHFTHGYVWLPLFLIALPWLERAALGLMAAGRRGRLLAAVLIVLAAADNISFLHHARIARPIRDIRWLDSEVFEIYRCARQLDLDGVLISNDPVASYLAASYTRMRPFFGHQFNTPGRRPRFRELDLYLREKRSSPRIEAADLLLVSDRRLPEEEAWQPLFEGERWGFYQRIARDGEIAAPGAADSATAPPRRTDRLGRCQAPTRPP